MSDLLIKDFSLPPQGILRTLVIDHEGHISFSSTNYADGRREKGRAFAEELPWHGDLVDGDRLAEKYKTITKNDDENDFDLLWEELWDALTILEANR